jgi:hypothetical protein
MAQIKATVEKMKELAVLVRVAEDNVDIELPGYISDIIFGIEVDYQAWAGLDENDWGFADDYDGGLSCLGEEFR